MSEKSHRDYLEIIGRNRATAKGWLTVQWNRYYHRTYTSVVRRMLEGVARGSVLDAGTSNGVWFGFLKAEGFARIYGVELHAGRAQEARAKGYDEVFNCDAAETPLPEASLDAAVSNSVFVHILRLDDKIRVIQRIERLLKPGGCFVFDHASAAAYFGKRAYEVRDYCSYMPLDLLLRLVHENTSLRVADVAPTYFRWRFHRPPRWLRRIHAAMALPGVPYLLWLVDRLYTAHRLGVEDAETFYVKLVKEKSADRGVS